MSTKYGVIENKSIYHEGDERSRTHPGHGYPAYTEQVSTLREFKNKEEMIEHYRNRTAYSKGRYIKWEEVNFEVTINVRT